MDPSQMRPLRLMPGVFTLLSIISQVALARSAEDNQNDGDSAVKKWEKLSTGDKAGIVICPIVVAFLLSYVIFWCFEKSLMRKLKEASQNT